MRNSVGLSVANVEMEVMARASSEAGLREGGALNRGGLGVDVLGVVGG